MPMSAFTGFTPPSTNDQDNFDPRADDFVSRLPLFELQATALEANVNAKELSAISSAATATAAMLAALAVSGAAMFAPATAYGQGQAAISGVNFLVYRRKTAGTSAADPSADAVNWAPVVPRTIVQDIATAVTLAEGILYRATATCSPLMPAAPIPGMRVSILKNTAALVTCMRNGSNMGGVADDRYLGSKDVIYNWIYMDAAVGWTLLAD